MKDSTDPAIRNFAFLDNSSSGGIRFIRPANSKNDIVRNPLSGKERRARSTQSNRAYRAHRDTEERKDANNWIPVEAYECALEFRNKYNLDMTDAKYQNEIKDLRAKLNMRMPFDEFNMRKQNENLKKNLMSTRDTLRDNIIMKHKLNEAPEGCDRVDNLFRTCQNFRKTRKCYEDENNRLKRKLKESKSEFSQCNDYHNGALWMAQKSYDEMNKFEKNFNELYGLYEEKVKNSLNNTDDNSLNNRIIDNSVNWFFNALKNCIKDSKSKMNEWRSDQQRNLNSLGFSVNHINY